MRLPVEHMHDFRIQTRRATSVKGEGLAVFDKARPSTYFSRWNGEASFLIHHRALSASAQQLDAKTIAWIGASYALHAYDIAPISHLDEGGLELEVVLSSKPDVNAWEFHVAGWEQFSFEYQPFLSRVNEDGSSYETNPWGGQRFRPAGVGGSFAIYANGVGGYLLGDLNREIGKVAHVFRPKAVNAQGEWTWCDLSFKEGVFTVTCPWSFLEKDAYPVKVDPTFGYSGTAASDDNFGAARILCKAVSTPASNGDVTSVTDKGRVKSGTNPEHDPAIYSDSSGAPGSRLAAVDSGGTVYGGSDAECTTNITLASIVSGTQYWLGSRNNNCGTSATTSDAFFKYDASGGTANMYFSVHNFDPTTAWESTASGYTSADNEKVYIYATFTSAVVSPSFRNRVGRLAPFKPIGDGRKGWH